MLPILAQVQSAFSDVPRPEHFTDFTHCSECAEHDETLRAYTPDTIGLPELGNPGWDPICFITDAGYLYYFPAMARLALGVGDEYYLSQFLFHLSPDRFSMMSPEQRQAVALFLEHLWELDFADGCGDQEQLELRIMQVRGEAR